MTAITHAALDALPFGLLGTVLGLAVAGVAALSPLLVGPVVGLATYGGAVALSLAVGDDDRRFPLHREAVATIPPF